MELGNLEGVQDIAAIPSNPSEPVDVVWVSTF